jgi:hypothetical protein
MTSTLQIRQRDKDTILQALSTGVVPRVGLPHIQVGRVQEVSALVRDVERIADGGSAVRFVIGEYGAGKTFFLSLVRLVALEKKCVTIHADLASERRIHASEGQARALYREAVRNISTRAKPDGGALPGIVEKFIAECVKQSDANSVSVDDVIEAKFATLLEYLGGHDYVRVLKKYWQGSRDGDNSLKDKALRWLRGEYSSKREANSDLGVRTIIDDASIYDSIKLLSAFVQLGGYAGLLVFFDEMVNLYKLQSAQARSKNYEEILRIVNDTVQGHTPGIGFVFGGTPEFLTDTRRGLYSYQALQSRLTENPYAKNGLVDMYGPVLRLQSLTTEDLLLLLEKIRGIFALGDPENYIVPDEALLAFMRHCNERVGEAYFRTPRNTIRAFVQLLFVLEQNPEADWQTLLGTTIVERDEEAALPEPDIDGGSVEEGEKSGGTASVSTVADDDDDDLASVKL